MLVINYVNLDCFIISVLPNRLDNGFNSSLIPIHTPKNRTREEKGERGNRSAREETVGEKGGNVRFLSDFLSSPLFPRRVLPSPLVPTRSAVEINKTSVRNLKPMPDLLK